MKKAMAMLTVLVPILALNVYVPEQVVSPQNNVATFTVYISNFDSENVTVQMCADATIPVTFSENNFVLGPNETRTVYVFALTKDLAPDTYPITLKVNNMTENLAVIVPQEVNPLAIYSEYQVLEVSQGSEATFKVLISNQGDELIRNIIIKSTIPQALNPKYAGPIDLLPGESRELEISFKVPEGYPVGTYEFYVYAESGSLSAQDKITVKVVEKVPLSEMLNVEVALPWEKLEKDGSVIGYKIPIVVENRWPSIVKNLTFEVATPEGWDVEVPTFNIGPHEKKTVYIDIVPTDFSERSITIDLVKDNDVIKEMNVTVAGYKIGITGFVFAGGNLIIGILVAIIVIAAILFIRQRNIYRDQVEKAKREAYLNNLTKKLNE